MGDAGPDGGDDVTIDHHRLFSELCSFGSDKIFIDDGGCGVATNKKPGGG